MHSVNPDNCFYFYNWESAVSQNRESERWSRDDILYAFKITWEEKINNMGGGLPL